MTLTRRAAACALAALVARLPARAGEVERHGLAMHGEPALPPGFAHFPYADPAAPQGGRLVLGVQGTFDGLNPFPVKGLTAAQGIAGLVFQSR